MQPEKFSVSQQEIIQFKKRRYIRALTHSALKRGQIKKAEYCELCSKKDCTIYAHHVDYGKPFEINWLCSTCHGKVHKSDHSLNPKNNKQTLLPAIVDKYHSVSVTFTIPITTFLALKERCDAENKTISYLLREQTIKNFPIEKNQMEFDFKGVLDGNSQHDRQQRICSLEKDETLLYKQKSPLLQKVRRKGNFSMQRMDPKFFQILGRHGQNASGLQRTFANR